MIAMKRQRSTKKRFQEEYLKLVGSPERMERVVKILVENPDNYRRLVNFPMVASRLGLTPRRLAAKVRRWFGEK